MKKSLLPALALVLMVGGRAVADDKPVPSYTKDVKPFLTMYCLECHGATRPKAGIDMTTYENLMKKSRKGFVVVASNPEQSLLFRTLTGNGKQMPPAKYAKKPTAQEIATMKTWIVAGAKDDTPANPPEAKQDAMEKCGLMLVRRLPFGSQESCQARLEE
jgi:hypothetical protein